MKTVFGRNPTTGRMQTYVISGAGHVVGGGIAPAAVMHQAAQMRMKNTSDLMRKIADASRSRTKQSMEDQQSRMRQMQEAAQKRMAEARRHMQQRTTTGPGLFGSTQPVHPVENREHTMSTHDEEMTNLYVEGQRLYHQHHLNESENAFSKLADDKEYYPAGHYGLGIVHFTLGKFESAEEHFKKSLEGDDPLCADALYYLGQIALGRRDVLGSMAFHRRALEKKAKHFGADRQLDSLERYTLNYAKALYRLRRFSESKKAFESLSTSRKYKAAGFYGIGVIEFQKGEDDSAMDRFRNCLNLHPRHANAWYYTGRIQEKRLKLEEAGGCYRKAVEINPKHVGALLQIKRLEKRAAGNHPAPTREVPARGRSRPAGPTSGRAAPTEAAELTELGKLLRDPKIKALLLQLAHAEPHGVVKERRT
jgi:tetratricopeptide (TPR) repeat protein